MDDIGDTMRTTTKKILASLLALAIALGIAAAPITAFAATMRQG